MTYPAADPIFKHALAKEVMASERLRVQVLAGVLLILLAMQQALFLSPFHFSPRGSSN